MAEQFVKDVNELDLNDTTPMDWDAYQDLSARKPTPAPGVYDVQLPNEFEYKKGSAGQLIVRLSPLKIVGGEHDGREILFTTVSTKKFKNTNACQAGDVLRNVGSMAQPTTKDEWQEAFKGVAGEVASKVKCVWRGWDKVAQKEYAEDDFPMGENGQRKDIVFIDTTDPQTGEVKSYPVFANLNVDVRGFAVKK
jgi:hypothetical protein